MEIGWRIKELIKEKQVMQKDLAKHLNVGAAYLSDVIHGKKVPLDTLAAICDFLGVSLTEFFRPFAEGENIPSYVSALTEACHKIESQEAAEALLPIIRFITSQQEPKSSNILCSVVHPEEQENNSVGGAEERNEEPKYYLPLLGGAVAGSPIYRPADDGDLVAVPETYADPDRFAVFQARGDSMEPRIPDGSMLVVELDAWPAEGEVAVVMLDGFSDAEYVVKRVYRKRGKVVLCSYNKAYNDKVIDADEVRRAYRMVCMISDD